MDGLIKFLVGLIIFIIIGTGLFFAKVFYLDDSKNEEQTKSIKKENNLDEEKVKKINDSMEQRDERIKALKEVGKKLGG